MVEMYTFIIIITIMEGAGMLEAAGMVEVEEEMVEEVAGMAAVEEAMVEVEEEMVEVVVIVVVVEEIKVLMDLHRTAFIGLISHY